HIDAKDVGAGLEQLANGAHVRRRRTERGEDLDPAQPSHCLAGALGASGAAAGGAPPNGAPCGAPPGNPGSGFCTFCSPVSVNCTVQARCSPVSTSKNPVRS